MMETRLSLKTYCSGKSESVNVLTTLLNFTSGHFLQESRTEESRPEESRPEESRPEEGVQPRGGSPDPRSPAPRRESRPEESRPEESSREMLGAGWILLGVAALSVSQLPLVSTELNCNVTQQPDGSIMYELSQPHASSCDSSWEDDHNIVIARNSDRNETLVQALNNQSITMKTCYDFLLYRVECSGVQLMTTCSVNCTRLLEQSPEIPIVNPDLICFTVDWCVTPVTFGLCVLAGVVVIAVIAAVVCLCIYKPRCVRTAETVSYSAPKETVNFNEESSDDRRPNRLMLSTSNSYF